MIEDGFRLRHHGMYTLHNINLYCPECDKHYLIDEVTITPSRHAAMNDEGKWGRIFYFIFLSYIPCRHLKLGFWYFTPADFFDNAFGLPIAEEE